MKTRMGLFLSDKFSADYVREKLSDEMKDVDIFAKKDECLRLMDALPLPSDVDAPSARAYKNRLLEIWACIEVMKPAVQKAIGHVEAYGFNNGGAPAPTSGLELSFSHVVL